MIIFSVMKMSDESTETEICDMSPEIPPLPPPLSRLDLSKTSRKKLNFEVVSQMLGSQTDHEDTQSKSKVSEKGAGRLETSARERVLSSQSSKLNALARGYGKVSGGDKTKGVPKTPSQLKLSTLATKRKGTSSANVKVPSKTPPALHRHSETMTPRIRPRPLTSSSNPELGKAKASTRISKEAFESGQKTPKTPEGPSDKQVSDSRKRPTKENEFLPSSDGSISDPEPPPKRSSIESQLTKILREVQKANTRLDSYDEKLDSLQERLQKLEEPKSSSISSSDASVTKRKVPPEVRVSMSI